MKRWGITATVALAVLLGWSPPASDHSTAPAARTVSAVPGFGPKTVVMTTCALPASTIRVGVPDSVLTASGPAGGIYGFASCRTNLPGAIYFFLSRAGRSMHQLTPYRGVLEAMASDGTGAVYLCYSVRTAVDTSLYIARRSAQGRYSPSALLTRTVGSFRPAVTLAASNGKWWAVWSEPVRTPRYGFAHPLFERRTLLGVRPRHEITFPGDGNSDALPVLAVAGSRIWLSWSRITRYLFNIRMITHARSDGSWMVSSFLDGTSSIDPSFLSHPPRFATSDGRSYLVYPPYLYLDNGTGHFIRQDGVLYAAYKPYLAASDSVVTFAELYTRELVLHPYVLIVELRAGRWSNVERSTVDSFDGVVSYAGRATFVMHKQDTPMLYLISET